MLINFYSFISLLNVSSFFFYFFNNNLISPLYQNSKKAIVFEYNKIEETFKIIDLCKNLEKQEIVVGSCSLNIL